MEYEAETALPFLFELTNSTELGSISMNEMLIPTALLGVQLQGGKGNPLLFANLDNSPPSEGFRKSPMELGCGRSSAYK